MDERPRIREIRVEGNLKGRSARKAVNDDLLTTKEELRGMLGVCDVVVLDLRSENGWKDSEVKIRGAIREIPMEMTSWAKKYSAEQRLVIYCD